MKSLEQLAAEIDEKPTHEPRIQAREIRSPEEHSRIFGEAMADVTVALQRHLAENTQGQEDGKLLKAVMPDKDPGRAVAIAFSYGKAYAMGSKMLHKLHTRVSGQPVKPDPTQTKKLSLAELAGLT